jgi:hypothetical protein
VPTQHIEKRVGILLVIEDPAAGVRPRRIELQPIYLDRLALAAISPGEENSKAIVI